MNVSLNIIIYDIILHKSTSLRWWSKKERENCSVDYNYFIILNWTALIFNRWIYIKKVYMTPLSIPVLVNGASFPHFEQKWCPVVSSDKQDVPSFCFPSQIIVGDSWSAEVSGIILPPHSGQNLQAPDQSHLQHFIFADMTPICSTPSSYFLKNS